MRFVEFLTPITCTLPEYEGIMVEPELGQLFSRRTHGGRIKPWSYPLNRRLQGKIWKEFIENSKL